MLRTVILFLGMAGSAVMAQTAGTFTTTGNMTTARVGHSATSRSRGDAARYADVHLVETGMPGSLAKKQDFSGPNAGNQRIDRRANQRCNGLQGER
jgi:hypothetical protein